jgi:hypothetical protein
LKSKEEERGEAVSFFFIGSVGGSVRASGVGRRAVVVGVSRLEERASSLSSASAYASSST